MPLTIQALGSADARQALRLTLAAAGQSSGDLERQVNAFLEYARALSLDCGRHWIARADGRVLAACTCLPSPGRTAMLFLPDGDTLHPAAADVERVVRHAMERQPELDSCIFQCLLRECDHVNRQALRAAGFRDLAVLLYMECRLGADRPPQSVDVASDWGTPSWTDYRSAHHDRFAALIAASFEGSLDCPGLNGLRSMAEIIAGHQAAGRFDPRRWLLLCFDGEPAGCILFGENPLQRTLELTYMGLPRRWRGRGVGRYVLRQGLDFARREGMETVTGAVDLANTPALRLYESAGFHETARRQAMIRVPASTSTAI